jgi:hypothetical protein
LRQVRQSGPGKTDVCTQRTRLHPQSCGTSLRRVLRCARLLRISGKLLFRVDSGDKHSHNIWISLWPQLLQRVLAGSKPFLCHRGAIVQRTPCVKVPITIWVSVPVRAILDRIKWQVAVAIVYRKVQDIYRYRHMDNSSAYSPELNRP